MTWTGLFADTVRAFVHTARTDYGCGFSYEDITAYDVRTVVDIDEAPDRPAAGSTKPLY